ncbi:FCD domain-containing protein [bacterium]|nr:FCD domain-containing protein [bacterium]
MPVNPVVAKKGNLVTGLTASLRSGISEGVYGPGARLPSETRLAEDHGVSRSVVREAIAALRADGLVQSRQGSGVYVIGPGGGLPFRDIDQSRISSVIEMLELRTGIETEAAELAARRCSPAQEERILEASRRVSTLARAGEPTSEADLAFHLSVAEATNNPMFVKFLTMLGQNAIPRRALRPDAGEAVTGSYIAMIDAEHGDIVRAIQQGDGPAARRAMRQHLEGSQQRYRALMREVMAARPD